MSTFRTLIDIWAGKERERVRVREREREREGVKERRRRDGGINIFLSPCRELKQDIYIKIIKL